MKRKGAHLRKGVIEAAEKNIDCITLSQKRNSNSTSDFSTQIFSDTGQYFFQNRNDVEQKGKSVRKKCQHTGAL